MLLERARGSSATLGPTISRGRAWPVAAACGLVMAAQAGAMEAGVGSAPGTWSVGVMAGEALNHNLVDLVPKALQGQLDFEPSHVAGVVIRRGIEPPEWLAGWGRARDIGISTSLELTVLKSRGLATNSEVALDWRPGFTPWQWGPVSVEFAWGLGVSHSFGKPWSDYTDPDRPEGHRTLMHMAPEMAFRHQSLPDTSLSLRVHHRSGLYGVFAPRRVGSNHLSLVLMHAF